MILFWSLAAAMVAVGLALLLPPLLGRRGRDADPDADDANIAIYRERLARADGELASGAISETQHAETVREIEDGVLADVGARPAGPPSGASRGAIAAVALIVAIAVPGIALGLYAHYGDPDAISAAAPAPPAEAFTADEIDEMVARLEARLVENPDDAEGWRMLGRSYAALERFAEAAQAYARAHPLSGDDPDLLVDWAEAEAAANDNLFSPAAAARIDRALAVEPRHRRALWLGGFAAAQANDVETARDRWRTLLVGLTPGSAEAGILEGLVARLGDPGATTGSTPAPGAASLSVHVRIDESLRAELTGAETVFVFASAVQGPPMPLAVVRLRADALPATVVLDDSSSMIPGRTLSSTGEVVIGARVALSGDPTSTSGDLEGRTGPIIVADADRIELRIDRVVP